MVDGYTNSGINRARSWFQFQKQTGFETRHANDQMKTASELAAIEREFKKADFTHRMSRKYGRNLPEQYSTETGGAVMDSGGGLIGTVTRFFYDEKKEGVQFANMAGGGLGAAAGLFMGNYMAGAAGGGWLGTTAMVVLAGAGLLFGSRLANEFGSATQLASFNNAPPSHGKTKAAEADAPDEQKHVSTIDPKKLQGLTPVGGGTNVDAPASLANVPRPAGAANNNVIS